MTPRNDNKDINRRKEEAQMKDTLYYLFREINNIRNNIDERDKAGSL